MAATVSVAQSTALSIMTSFRLRASLKTYLLIKTMKMLMRMNPRMVPMTPKKLIMPKC